MRILGIDPGSQKMGFAIIDFPKKKVLFVDTLFLNYTKKSDNFFLKIRKIYEKLERLIHDYCPEVMAIEAPFYGKNAQSMLKLGQIQGVCFALAIQHGLQIQEYKPRQVKRAIAGNGNASKEQVQGMLQYYFPETHNLIFSEYDASDALAIALTCGFHLETTFDE